ncbi:helix-turn-helix domain-containing protein [Polaromonas naphthalenivorans]|uniref:Putative transcriptional regulator n=1 Tax=Polaromonas naphthalenivorans (strain CJ2) TaxID=365044 RepID=A1VVB3_POLNA|nr:transcriptional regulator [Polaromonas naphthalenivorans]ABM39591.1 putative transcriptional regulator [Polaromonas naphthalenivorans CJ2]
MESTIELSAYGLVSKTDMARMKALCEVPPEYPPERVVSIRTEIAKMSQAVFASLLNLSVSTVQKWESPVANQRPSGSSAKLLHVLEKKGIEGLLI